MTKYVRKGDDDEVYVDAVRWFKQGDHPDECPDKYSWTIENKTGGIRERYVFVDPGDWVVTHLSGVHSGFSDKLFRSLYE